ncbi:hypothetical protein FDW83_09375 [Pseudarthrobacter sp. NamE2]|uniref:hypothetical protein n=1 Tax=Pseudarthrobacter sp. NamE2 TaxID=2576838 RepID=UPI0010FE715A|nr:hypothetical protein [Pseudarthrobacter sp. NamE2]TLM83659.1 hypothetical protein FDW83_09375 [Pseudarthrobacter sp. NamE2]
MSDRAPRPGRSGEAGRASAWKSPRAWRVLAVMFSVAAIGSVVLVVVDLVLGRPAAGDLFIAFLNSLAAVALWRLGSETRRT